LCAIEKKKIFNEIDYINFCDSLLPYDVPPVLWHYVENLD